MDFQMIAGQLTSHTLIIYHTRKDVRRLQLQMEAVDSILSELNPALHFQCAKDLQLAIDTDAVLLDLQQKIAEIHAAMSNG
jgi:hypothetical protein